MSRSTIIAIYGISTYLKIRENLRLAQLDFQPGWDTILNFQAIAVIFNKLYNLDRLSFYLFGFQWIKQNDQIFISLKA